MTPAHSDRTRGREVHAHLGFVGVHRDEAGRMRVRLLTSRRSLGLDAEGPAHGRQACAHPETCDHRVACLG